MVFRTEELHLFIEGLKRDRARGSIAPHQIILLISFLNLTNSLAKNHYKIEELSIEFDSNWAKYSHLYSTKNINIGMPIKAMMNKSLLEIKTKDTIFNYRKRKEILSKIETIKLSNELKTFLNSVNLDYLIRRITY